MAEPESRGQRADRVVRWAERRALDGSGVGARIAVAYVCLRMRALTRVWLAIRRGDWKPYRYRWERCVLPVLRVLCSARDERVAGAAGTAVQWAWDHGAERSWCRTEPRSWIWNGLWDLTAVPRKNSQPGSWLQGQPFLDLPYPAMQFLLCPKPDCRCPDSLCWCMPQVQLIAALQIPVGDKAVPCDPASSYMLSAAKPQEPPSRFVVNSAMRSADPRTRRALGELLRTTDHPNLLEALEDTFVWALCNEVSLLWDSDHRPTELMQILLENPHLPRQPSRYGLSAQSAALGVARNRFDLARHVDGDRSGGLARILLHAAAGPVPPALADGCRRLLRELGPGRGREALCEAAIDGDSEARAAVADTGYLPADPAFIPLFLFCTEQWDRYEQLDPKGLLLAEHGCRYSYRDWHRLEAVASRTGRSAPQRPKPPPPAKDERYEPPRYRHGGTGTAGTGGFGGGF